MRAKRPRVTRARKHATIISEAVSDVNFLAMRLRQGFVSNSSSCSFIVALPQCASTVAEAETIIDAQGVASELIEEEEEGSCCVNCLLDLRTTIEQLKDFPGFPSQTHGYLCPACTVFWRLIENPGSYHETRCYLCGVEAIEDCMKLRDWALKHDHIEKPGVSVGGSFPESDVTQIPPKCDTSRLPAPLLANIWSFMPLSYVLASVQVVCRHWRDLISSNSNPYMSSFWRQQGMHFLPLMLNVNRCCFFCDSLTFAIVRVLLFFLIRDLPALFSPPYLPRLTVTQPKRIRADQWRFVALSAFASYSRMQYG